MLACGIYKLTFAGLQVKIAREKPLFCRQLPTGEVNLLASRPSVNALSQKIFKWPDWRRNSTG
jgi:hypothetical protein